MTTRVPIYGLDWHQRQSPSQRTLVLEPLERLIDFQQITWNGEEVSELPSAIQRVPAVFYQFPPPRSLLRTQNARLVWIPMWDHARFLSSEWWQTLPKTLRVVAFSGEVEKKAKRAGLSNLRITYCANPSEWEPTSWRGERVLMYWNRVGLVGPVFLQRLCETLGIGRMIFIRRVDPLIPSWFDYPLPSRIGNTITTQVSSDGPLPRQDYLGLFNQANIFIAPRLSEGVGLTFIEALARGCAVFAYNAPTMNEYISSGMNGYLLPRYGSSLLRFLGERVRSRLLRYRAEWMTREPFFEHRVSEWQDWEAIGKLDLVTLGNSAREGQAIGFAKWRELIPDLARFILDW